MLEHEYVTADATELRKLFARPERFVTMDPGVRGAAIVWGMPLSGGLPTPADVIPYTGEIEDYSVQLGRSIELHGARLVISEAQYSGPNKRTALLTARRAGMVIGLALQRATMVHAAHVVWVPPSAWQVVLTGGDALGRASLKARSHALLASAAVVLPESCRTKQAREGVADAYGIGRWWQRRMKWTA